MVGVFVRLKLRLLTNGLQDTGRLVGFALGITAILVSAPLAGYGWFVLGDHPELAGDVGVLVFVVLALAWVMLPLGLFGVDDTLDLARFAAFPLRPRALVTGLFVAAFAGLAPLATAVLLVGSVVGLSSGGLSVAVAVLAFGIELALCVALSRAVAAALSGVLRSRRGRDLAILVGVLIGGSGQVLALGVAYLSSSTELLRSAAAVLRWTPPGLAASAVTESLAGHYLVAAASLLGAGLCVPMLLWWWARTLTTAMLSTDASTGGRVARAGSGLAGRLHAAGRAGAVAARELRYNWREPRRRSSWMAAVLFGGVGPFIALRQDQAAGSGPVYICCLTAAIIGLQAVNQLGVDGAATWMHVATSRDKADIRADFAGRNLALAVIGVPILLLLSVSLAAWAGSAGAAVEPLVVACAILALSLGVGNVASVIAPFPLPEGSTNVFSGASAGQGCLAGLVVIGSLTATAVLAVPLLIGPLLVHSGHPMMGAAALVAGLGYAVGIAWPGRLLGTAAIYHRQPELLQVLIRRSAD